MKLILWLTLCFITYDLLKLFMLPFYWKATMNRSQHPALVIIETFYAIYVVMLFFVGYWYVGLPIIIVSIISAYQLMDNVMQKVEFNKQIRSYLTADNIISALFLLIIIIKEFKLLTL
jgi:hypothetical protein